MYKNMGEMSDWVLGDILEQDGEELEEYAPVEQARSVKIEAEVIVRWEKALLVKVEGHKPRWVPFSLIGKHSDLNNKSRPGDKGPIDIPAWLAYKKGWM